MQYLVNPFSKLPQPHTDVAVLEGGCSHWSSHAVNPQHVNRDRFALRNSSSGEDESGQIVMWQGICVTCVLPRKREAYWSAEHFVLQCRRIGGVDWNASWPVRWKTNRKGGAERSVRRTWPLVGDVAVNRFVRLGTH